MADDSISQVCPRCGLSLRPRTRWLAVEHCPRCIAYARIPVRMSSPEDAGAERPRARGARLTPRP